MAELTGKALGIAVAKALGWMQWKRVGQPVTYPYWTDPGEGADELYLYRDLEECESRFYDASWAPWCDMNDATEVVKQVLSDWYCFRTDTTRDGHWAGFEKFVPETVVAEGTGKVFCEAILRAALAAKEQEEESNEERTMREQEEDAEQIQWIA